MNISCPSCSSPCPIDDALPGTFHRCAACGHRFRVPRAVAAPAVPTAGLRAAPIAAALVILLLLLLPWFGRLFAEPPRVLLFLGRFHPLVVHLPIGMLIVAFLMEMLAFVPRHRVLREAAGVVIFLGALTAVAAAVFGQFLSDDGYKGDLLDRHQFLGFSTAIAAVLASLCKATHRDRPSLRTGFLYGLVLTAAVTLLNLAGHAGGTLTHGAGYLTHYMPPVLAGLFGEPTAEPAPPEAAAALGVYAELIDPIFQARCTSCHGDTKQKGEFRIDSFAALMVGGKTAPAIVPGRSDEGELVYRITVPRDDVDAMPPDGKTPLTKAEVALVVWWVSSGADAEATLDDVDVPDAIRQILDARVPPGERGRRNAEAAAKAESQADLVARLRGELGANLLPLAQDSPDLQFSPAGSPQAIGDAELEQLAPLADSLVWLDLAGSGVGDQGLAHIAAMKNLKRLSLQNTAVTSAGLRHLAGLSQLEYLNLYGTQTDDEGLAHLAGMTGLKSLYLWQTPVSDAGIDELQKALPNLAIHRGAELPNAEDPSPAPTPAPDAPEPPPEE